MPDNYGCRGGPSSGGLHHPRVLWISFYCLGDVHHVSRIHSTFNGALYRHAAGHDFFANDADIRIRPAIWIWVFSLFPEADVSLPFICVKHGVYRSFICGDDGGNGHAGNLLLGALAFRK